jgi:hypothetical protein
MILKPDAIRCMEKRRPLIIASEPSNCTFLESKASATRTMDGGKTQWTEDLDLNQLRVI